MIQLEPIFDLRLSLCNSPYFFVFMKKTAAYVYLLFSFPFFMIYQFCGYGDHPRYYEMPWS